MVNQLISQWCGKLQLAVRAVDMLVNGRWSHLTITQALMDTTTTLRNEPQQKQPSQVLVLIPA